MNWIKIGMQVAPFVASSLLSIVIVVLAFRKYIAPEFTAQMDEATKTIKTLAGLGGIKKADYATSKELGKSIAADFLKDRFPEAEALKLILSPKTWEQVEAAMEENPEAIMQLIDKYGDVLGIGGAQQQTAETDF